MADYILAMAFANLNSTMVWYQRSNSSYTLHWNRTSCCLFPPGHQRRKNIVVRRSHRLGNRSWTRILPKHSSGPFHIR